jgi:hypothetical protein
VKQWIKPGLVVCIALLAVAQLFRPARENPPSDPALGLRATGHVTPGALAVIERSCRDCHSSETVWPWYSNVAPMSWLVANHVREGRREFNYSDWGSFRPDKVRHVLEKMCEEVMEGGMPLPSYLPMHPDARLSPDDVKALCSWAEAERARLASAEPGKE